MRVLLVAEQLRRAVPGGIGTYVRGLAQGLAQADGADVTAFASRGGDLGLGLAQRTSPLPGPVLTRAWDAGLLGAPGGFDVVHATSLAHPRSRRLAVTVHDVAWREVPEAFPPRGRRWHEAALRRALVGAGAIVVPSQRTADALGGEAAGAVHVVPEGCDHLPPPDDAAADALLAAHGVTGPFLLTVSTLEPRKNLARLLSAYTIVRTRLPEPWPLLVVGPVGWGPALAPVDGAVLTGPAPPAVLAALYRRARCLAYVPLVEGFGLPPVEALHAGLPVVASAMPSTTEGDHAEGATVLVDPLDPAAIAGAIASVATDDALRAGLVANGEKRAAILTWKNTAERHLTVWRALCG